MRSILKIFLPLILIGFCTSNCSKSFLDDNDDPNRVTDDKVTAELLFPQAVVSEASIQSSAGFNFLNNWLGYQAPAGDYSLNQSETTYTIDFAFSDPFWATYYNTLFDLYKTIQKSETEGNRATKGASLIIWSKMFQELVDMFGDIPYSKAFQNDLTTTPKYDKAQAIYDSLLVALDSAVADFQTPPSSAFKNVDIVYLGSSPDPGDPVKWIKLANTLRLRLLIRQSQIPGFDPSATLAKIKNDGGVLQAGESISVNPGYSNSQSKQSPFYANYGKTPSGGDANKIVRANDYFLNLLKLYSDTFRLKRIYNPPSGNLSDTLVSKYVGSVYGKNGNPVGTSESQLGPGFVIAPEQNAWIYPSFESLFLQAEAVARGWLAGDAKTAYQNAVIESFIWLNPSSPVAATNAANAYLATASIANWANAGADAASQAKFIAYQKYIAISNTDPQEAWADLRRLNMIPNTNYLSQNPANTAKGLPVRLLYPQTEYTTNTANVVAEGTIDAFNSKIFWQP